MPTLAFWNIAANVAPATIAAFAHDADADILILAENKIANHDLVLALNAGVERYYLPDSLLPQRLSIFTRFLSDQSRLVADYPEVAIREYHPPVGDSVTVVAVHLPSKLYRNTEDQAQGAVRIARYIRDAEEQVGHDRTLLIGDLNMNPFEAGVVGSAGLHAVMDRQIASKGSRVVAGESCTYFYNPMWSLLGDRGPAPPGTHFYNSATEVNYFWNLFDQVLVRPALLKFLQRDAVSIVTEIAGVSLLNKGGRPNRRAHSDHLPVVCRLALVKELVNG